MPYLQTPQEWLTQSSLLLQARPTTTRITTKYTTIDPSKPLKTKKTTTSQEPTTTTGAALPSARATLNLKTYDPVSGVTLKYKTTKQQEVGRLFASLGRLGRHMAGLPELTEDVVMGDAPAKEDGAEGVATGVLIPSAEKVPAAGASQGGKKKKKGKK